MMQYAKAAMAAAATAIAAIAAALVGDNTIDPGEVLGVIIMTAGACGVFAAPNVPGARYTKAILAVITAALTAAATMLTGGLTVAEILEIILAGLAAIGVYSVPNLAPPTPPTVQGRPAF